LQDSYLRAQKRVDFAESASNGCNGRADPLLRNFFGPGEEAALEGCQLRGQFLQPIARREFLVHCAAVFIGDFPVDRVGNFTVRSRGVGNPWFSDAGRGRDGERRCARADARSRAGTGCSTIHFCGREIGPGRWPRTASIALSAIDWSPAINSGGWMTGWGEDEDGFATGGQDLRGARRDCRNRNWNNGHWDNAERARGGVRSPRPRR
jgi:hypothetical protein